MKKYKILSIFLALIVLFASCEKEDYTGYSKLKPTNPTITVDFGTIVAANDGVESTHTVTLNMDVAQIVDVAVNVFVIDGTATEDLDFSLSEHTVVIPAGKTQATFDVEFLTDDLPESTETFTIQVGDAKVANANMTPVTADFTILNAVSDDLVIDMSWASEVEVYDVSGEVISPYSLADLILSVTDDAGNEVYNSDGGSAEEVVFINADQPDGLYYVTAAFYSAMNLGDQGDVGLNLTFDYLQSGVFSNSFDFPNYFSINTALTCSEAFRVMQIEKNGTSYTISPYVDPFADFLGNYGGTDYYDSAYLPVYTSDVYTTVCGTNLMMNKLCYQFMTDGWGETVKNIVPLAITLNADGTISIDDQYYMTTDYNGDLYDYNIINVVGTWTDAGVFHIEYDLLNTTDGYTVTQALIYYGYGTKDYFEADINIGAKNMAKLTKNIDSPDKLVDIKTMKNRGIK